MESWKKMFFDLKNYGKEFSPRGLKILEIENYHAELDTYNRFCNFPSRKLNIGYMIAELCWYIKGDRDNEMMEHYSSFWKKVKNKEKPFYNSNYGHYIFNEGQFSYCFNMLKKDKDSRQACIIINRPSVMMSETNDKLCTYSINFLIRNNKLNMHINMRSNDIIYGLSAADFFCFSVIQELLFILLKEKYNDLEMGSFFHHADSFHIYENKFEIMNSIFENNENNEEVVCPKISSKEEVLFILLYLPKLEENIRKKNTQSVLINKNFKFSLWCQNYLLQINK
jgi:thymidylate synthase